MEEENVQPAAQEGQTENAAEAENVQPATQERQTENVSEDNQSAEKRAKIEKWVKFGCFIAVLAAIGLTVILTLFCFAQPLYRGFDGKVAKKGSIINIFAFTFADKNWSMLNTLKNLIDFVKSGAASNSGPRVIFEIFGAAMGLILGIGIIIADVILVILTAMHAVKKRQDKLFKDLTLAAIICVYCGVGSLVCSGLVAIGSPLGEFGVGGGVIAAGVIDFAIIVTIIVLRNIRDRKRILAEINLKEYLIPAIKFGCVFIIFMIFACGPTKQHVAYAWNLMITLLDNGSSLYMRLSLEYLMLCIFMVVFVAGVAMGKVALEYYYSVENAKSPKINYKKMRNLNPISHIFLGVVNCVLCVLLYGKDEYASLFYDSNPMALCVVATVLALAAFIASIVLKKMAQSEQTEKEVK